VEGGQRCLGRVGSAICVVSRVYFRNVGSGVPSLLFYICTRDRRRSARRGRQWAAERGGSRRRRLAPSARSSGPRAENGGRRGAGGRDRGSVRWIENRNVGSRGSVIEAVPYKVPKINLLAFPRMLLSPTAPSAVCGLLLPSARSLAG
jgi:hypothetical protein